ncbi:grainy head [Oratosquilla oratoria]|uniref:grainy head n=1 Tax=Oratosquilla oratoria TaxID=337810 RepID=UPI003F75FAAE
MSAGAGSYITGFPATSPQTSYEHMPTYLASSPQPYATSSSPAVRGSPSVYTVATEYYPRDYYTTTDTQYGTVRQEYSASDVAFVDRYLRPANAYKTTTVSGLTVDLPSPDSGISADAITPRDQATITQQNFEYGEVVQQGSILGTDHRVAVPGTSPNLQRSTRPWHEFRHTDSDKMQIPKIHSDDDKIHIPKIHSAYGFKYHLESPISTSQRREDDRITYINKGQFYGITMEYIPDPDKPLKATTVKSVVMLMFREEKTPEDEIKAWQFWHGRQHSVKQRILDVDTKNSVGVVPGIEEVAHNAIAVYWMPLEQSAKINIAVQCLSTDFSSQKGVKGLPLHIQIDTYEDARDNSQVFHRGYCQIKVFCDKQGAERKTRDEERRATKRRMNATGRKKYEDLYHASCDRSEFYSMSDLSKPPVLFTPAEDVEKITSMELGFYGHDPENGVCSVGVTGGVSTVEGPSPTTLSPQHGLPTTPGRGVSPTLDPIPTNTPLIPAQVPPPVASPTSKPITTSSTYKFHYSFPQPYGSPDPIQGHSSHPGRVTPPSRDQHVMQDQWRTALTRDSGFCSDARKDLATTQLANGSLDSPMAEVFTHVHKRSRLTPPLSERVMLYVRQDNEELYTPLHLVPPSTIGLMKAIELKYKIPMSSIKNIYRKNRIGIMAKVDDDMLRMYCNEDTFLMEIQPRDADAYDLTLIELGSGPEH